MQAAFNIGVFEQRQLQSMWNDPVLRFAAQAMQGIGMLDTDIHTPLGDIRTPDGLTGGPWDLDYRVGIARNGFDFMYQNVFKPSPLSTFGQNAMQRFFGDVWQQNQPRWKPKPGDGT